MKILVGTLTTGRYAGGIDAYLMNFLESLKGKYPEAQVDFLTNKKQDDLERSLLPFGSRLFETSPLSHPLKQYKEIRSIIKQNGYDIAYMNVSTAVNCMGAAAARAEGVERRIVHAHASGSLDASKLMKPAWDLLNFMCRPVIYRNATDYWTNSQSSALWVFPSKVVWRPSYKVVPLGIDTSKFRYDAQTRKIMRERLGLGDAFVVGHVGRFSHVKNHRFMVDTFKSLTSRAPDARLLLVGDGELASDIKEYTVSLGLEHSVIFAGKRDNVEDYLQAMDAFILPSLSEGLGYAALEAESTGLKCFLSKSVPLEVDMTGNCLFLDIKKKGAHKKWAKAIFDGALKYDRVDQSRKILNSGYGLDNLDVADILFGDV